MNIFGFFRERSRLLNDWTSPIPRPVRPDRNRVPYPFRSVRAEDIETSELDLGNPSAIVPDERRAFAPTHIHARTGKFYMLTSDGDRLEVTGDDAYPLAEYEDADGNRYAQRADRFHDGRFVQYEEWSQ